MEPVVTTDSLDCGLSGVQSLGGRGGVRIALNAWLHMQITRSAVISEPRNNPLSTAVHDNTG